MGLALLTPKFHLMIFLFCENIENGQKIKTGPIPTNTPPFMVLDRILLMKNNNWTAELSLLDEERIGQKLRYIRPYKKNHDQWQK